MNSENQVSDNYNTIYDHNTNQEMNSSTDTIKDKFQKVQHLESKIAESEKSTLANPATTGEEDFTHQESGEEDNTSTT